ncbi:MAG: hypothetical protein AB1486_13110 [Planctomycetota bacterium]
MKREGVQARPLVGGRWLGGCCSVHSPFERCRGVALILTLIILGALLALAVPFSWSMRNHREAAEVSLGRSQVEADVRATIDLVHATLGRSHPELDETPYWDDERELTADVAELRRLFDLQGGESATQKIWSARTRDVSGLVDLNSASIYLLGNLLGLSAVLTAAVGEEVKTEEIALSDASLFPESGILWADGELIGYASRSGNRLREITRAMTTAIFAPPEPPAPSKHRAGSVVVDYRVWLLATYLYNYRVGVESALATIEEAANISRFGEQAFSREELDRIRDFVTVNGRWPTARWINAQALAAELEGGKSQDLLVANGHHYTAGSIARITSEGDVREYGNVVASRPARRGQWRVQLALPVENSVLRDRGVVECLVRHPVNINTAPRQVLLAILENLRVLWDWDNSYIDSGVARDLAERLIAARPFKGVADLDAFLDELVDQQLLHPSQAKAVYLNAFNPQDYLLPSGTAPFVFASAGTFEIEAAVSDNYRAGGRERARLFASETVAVAPRGRLTAAFLTQRDFLDAIRYSRQGRFWATEPVQLRLFDQDNEPPREIRGDVIPGWNLNRYASEDAKEAALRLAPARLEDPREEARSIHFDEQPFLSEWIDGRNLEQDGALPLDTRGDVARLVTESAGSERFLPFAISLWWIPGESGAEHVLFDSGVTDAEDRILLRYSDGVLRFQVFDHGWPRFIDAGLPTAAEWYYEFENDESASLPFEAKVPYHVTAFAKGARPGELLLFIDGIPRGKPRFMARLAQSLENAEQEGVGGFLEDRPVVLDDQAGLPSEHDVVRVGRELIEYSGASGGRLTLSREGERLVRLHDQQGTGNLVEKTIYAFGGRGARFTPSPARPARTPVSLYGYTAVLSSPEIPDGEARLDSELGPFRVGRIDYRDPQKLQDIKAPAQPGGPGGPGGFPEIIGKGLTPEMTEIPVCRLDGTDIEEDTFQTNGGYALIVTAGTVDDGRGRDVETADDGSYVNGPEVIFYGSFDKSRNMLLRVQRGPALAKSSLAPPNLAGSSQGGGSGEGGGGSSGPQFLASRSHLVELRFPDPPEVLTYPGTFVIPISIDVPGAGRFVEQFQGGGRRVRCELLQIDLDFDDKERSATEWVRYNSVVQNRHVLRDDAENLTRTYNYLRYRWDDWQTDRREALDGKDEDDLRDEYDEVNYEVTLDIDNDENPDGHNRLAFRGVLGTTNCEHAAQALVLPVFRTFKWRQETGAFAHPGRHDHITIVNAANDRREEAQINFAWCGWSEDDSGARWARVALRAGVSATFRRGVLGINWDTEDPLEAIANDVTLSESRGFTRLLKFPSGELPAENSSRIFVGGDLRGAVSPGGGYVDEVRFYRPNDPHEFFRHGCYALARDCDEDEESRVYLRTRHMRFPHLDLSHDTVAAYSPFANLPSDAGLLLVNDEVIAYNEKGSDGELKLAPSGRGLFGGEPAPHPEDSTVVFLGFAVVSRLASGISAIQGTIEIADARDFPDRGLVLIDEELLIYDRKDANGVLVMGQRLERNFGGKPEGILRGRFGTIPAAHEEGALVLLMPARHWDLYEPGVDHPSLAPFEFCVATRRAFFGRVGWDEEIPDARIDLVALARLDGRSPWDGDVEECADLFRFDSPESVSGENRIERQGDLLELRYFVEYKDGAYDARAYRQNAWKRTPVLRWVAVDYWQDNVVERYEEARR